MSTRENGGSPGPERDTVLDRVYAAGPREEPPAGLDAAILAAARRGVHASPRPVGTVLRGWRMPVAVAAVLVLSVSVVLLMREEGAHRVDDGPPASAPAPDTGQRGAEPVQPPAKSESAPLAAPALGAAATGTRDAPAPREAAVEEHRFRERRAEPDTAAGPPQRTELRQPAAQPFAESPASSAEPPRPALAMPPARALAKEAQSGPSAVPGSSGRPVPAPPPSSAPAAAEGAATTAGKLTGNSGTELARSPARSQELARAPQPSRDEVADASRPAWFGLDGQPPEKWLVRIEELRRAGRETDAQQVLAEFRRRYPEHAGPPAAGK